MKIRLGFVSNSSSSSFLIRLEYLSSYQLEAISDHIETARKMFPEIEYAEPRNAWDIRRTDEALIGSTYMDNFSMEEFLRELDVPDKNIKWAEFESELE